MASAAQVILVDPAPGAEEYARGRLAELERRWSRFDPGSDVSRLNATPGALVMVSVDTVALLTAMRHASQETGGRYDPTLLAAINAAGYATSIDGSNRSSSTVGRARRRCSIADVAVDPITSAVMVPAGLGLDPGGIGKGLAADMVVAELIGRGTRGALVGVGGDLAAAGTPPTELGWQVAVDDPLDVSRELARFTFDVGGVATSSTVSRTWLQGDRPRHHVIDPATRTCATTDLAAVTVIARAGWEAETHATAALLLGSGGALDYLNDHQLDGMATTLDGVTTTTSALACACVGEGSVT